MSEEVDGDVHPIFQKDPEEWRAYVYKQVTVVLEDDTEHVGWVYTVDPVSETVVLVNFDNNTRKVELLLGHAVRSINVLNENTDAHKEELDRLFRPESSLSLSPEEIKQRQEALKMWLLKNRLPVEVGGSEGELLMISDALVIKPPYAPQNCYSTNEIVLGRIQGLIKNMPQDHQKW